MEKDYLTSEKYSQAEIDSLQVPYALQDACVDSLCDYRSCVNQSRWNFLPFFHNVGPCRQLYDRWIICQSNREFEIKERRRSQLVLAEQGDTLRQSDLEGL